MTTTYTIEVFHVDRDGWVHDLRQAVDDELLDLGLHRTVSVDVRSTAPTTVGPVVGVYLGSPAAARDAGLDGRIRGALGSGIVVVPVVDSLAMFKGDVPPLLTFANGYEWSGSTPAVKLARILLEDLGIEDRERRVFISHKRDDGLGAAEQLHDHLTHTGFRPFIDRFAIRAGEGVQEHIADALEDHAFLLLLETPLAHTSAWVFDEVDYALSHTMGVLILQWPSDPVPVPGSPGVPRLLIEPGDLVKDAHGFDVFTDEGSDRVVAAVEASHAHGLVRRRRMLVQSVEEAARASGCTACVPLPHWRIWVEHATGATLVGVTPRLPTATDLENLDVAREAAPAKPAAVLVHSSRVLRAARRKHLEWVTGPRNLSLAPENAIGGWW